MDESAAAALPEVLPVLAALVRIPSVNPTLDPVAGGGEAAIARWAHGWLESHGLRSRLEEAAPGRPNVVAETGGGEPTLVLCAHLDTVSSQGMTIPPFTARVENGRLYGRGAYDMKGSAAAVMVAAAALARQRVAGRLVVALVVDEEHASLGAQHFLAHHRADGCILTEPSEGALVLAHKGFAWLEVTTTGRAAHGSRWDLGVSAIAEMGRAIVALERFDAEVLRRRVHPLVGPASQHCSLVTGGAGLSTYAERCVLSVERRTLPGEAAEPAVEELREVLAGAGVAAEVRLVLSRPPLTCLPDSPVARAVREAATAVCGAPPPEGGVGYWMDAALFAAAGIPTVDYGPAGAGAHEAVEWVDVASVTRCARVLEAAARSFFAAGGR
jgi:acetylornithine deacetylase